jgi:glycosyltransferase involved in cell wall biosynthesis
VPYKRIDIAIEACRLAHMPLRIVGDGPERRRLEALAGPDVTFLGVQSDAEVRELYRGSKGLLLPGEEDFGIAPVEAQACGRPVVGLDRGGASETVHDGSTGVLVDAMTPEAFADGIARAGTIRFDSAVIRQHSLQFSYDRFYKNMRHCLEATSQLTNEETSS